MEGHNVAEHTEHHECNPGVLSPEIPGNEDWKKNGEEKAEFQVVAVLEHDHRIMLEV